MPDEVTVYKRDHMGREVTHYHGVIIARGETWIQLEARFNRDDKHADYVTFRRGDRYIEWFYTDRMYNIFEIHDVDDDHLKGWYCNICHPAIITADSVCANDVALDLWVTPSGEMRLLDEDEFRDLPIDVETRARAGRALDELRRRVTQRQNPFDAIAH